MIKKAKKIEDRKDILTKERNYFQEKNPNQYLIDRELISDTIVTKFDNGDSNVATKLGI